MFRTRYSVTAVTVADAEGQCQLSDIKTVEWNDSDDRPQLSDAAMSALFFCGVVLRCASRMNCEMASVGGGICRAG
jgi:hypothetical protein